MMALKIGEGRGPNGGDEVETVDRTTHGRGREDYGYSRTRRTEVTD